MTTKEQAVINAVEYAKKSQFGLTAIKVEMEINFNRGLARRPDELGCDNCVAGHMDCTFCDGGCSYCNYGDPVVCRNCYADNTDFQDYKSIQDAILKPLVKHKLAEKIPKTKKDSYGHVYRPAGALKFARTMYDATVDTEMTFTLSMENSKDVLKLPEFLKSFYALKDKIGQSPSVASAGLHISFLNASDYGYPADTSPTDMMRFRNFKKSMILLMPALYFLGSPNERSRGLTYRQPMVEREHRAAINYSHGALEFRVFETCYDTPEAILDNIVVMSNCLRFWTKRYTRNHLQKITKEVVFGITDGDELKRLYRTALHIDLLNRGLRIIKPSYKSITELKQERNFTVTKQSLRQNHKLAMVEAEKQYGEYENKFGWEQVMRKNSYINDFLSDRVVRTSSEVPKPGDEQTLKVATEYGEQMTKSYESRKESKEVFCEKAIVKMNSPGEYRLGVA